jgi:hypothetical protein
MGDGGRRVAAKLPKPPWQGGGRDAETAPRRRRLKVQPKNL